MDIIVTTPKSEIDTSREEGESVEKNGGYSVFFVVPLGFPSHIAMVASELSIIHSFLFWIFHEVGRSSLVSMIWSACWRIFS
ncbi:MAG: hypothetical protein ACQ9MH_27180 [Nitrospinales bacterium]